MTVNSVEVRHVTKRFTLRHTRSLKEMAVWKSRGRDTTNIFLALDDVALNIKQGEAVGLLGWNGSGKSTLLKLISGVMRPDMGSIGVRGRVAGLIEVGAGFHPDLTGRENVYLNGATLGMSRRQIDRLFDDIVDFSGVSRFLDTEVKFYSSGMFFRLASCTAVASRITSTTKTSSGTFLIFRTPERRVSRRVISRVISRPSFLVRRLMSPESRNFSRRSSSWMRRKMVDQFVIMPPSQRSVT